MANCLGVVAYSPEYFVSYSGRKRLSALADAPSGPNLLSQNRTVSWQMFMPRSCTGFSTFQNESG